MRNSLLSYRDLWIAVLATAVASPLGAQPWRPDVPVGPWGVLPKLSRVDDVEGEAGQSDATQTEADGTAVREDIESLPAKEQALRWVEVFGGNDVLYLARDVQAWRDQIASMSEAEAEDWLARTAPLRELLVSPAWQVTQGWLRDFFAVQAIYSEQEVEVFRQRLAQLAPEEQLRVLQDIQVRQLWAARKQATFQRYRQTSIVPYSTGARGMASAAQFSLTPQYPQLSGGPNRPSRFDRAIQRHRQVSRRVADYYLNRLIYGRAFFFGLPIIP